MPSCHEQLALAVKERDNKSDSLVIYTTGGKWGFKDSFGNEVAEAKYDFAKGFSEGMAVVWKAFPEINKHNKYITLEYYLDPWENTYFKKGYIDKTGAMVIEPQYGKQVPKIPRVPYKFPTHHQQNSSIFAPENDYEPINN